ncbi:MAG TPA: hypothetical protein VFX03_16730, partial [Thermomicrobiales bacterium]|nr:hypothetical protein [Thermomicrobiales bacterium]
HRLTPLREFDLVVVDDGIDEPGLRQLRHAQVPFEVVPIDAGGDTPGGSGAETVDVQGDQTLLSR